MVARLVYLVQAFSRDPGGLLVQDVPAWSRDASFAASLTQTLRRRKAGVLTIAAALDASGSLAAEAEIVAGHGFIPRSLLLPTGDCDAGERRVPYADLGNLRRRA